ncbi:NAD(P)/FAD-dependent oxidoreductase [uncultured Friedmanniella sp.]|uniref:NAD(P)/FAD-dependent oxidoreductase n=1 Tax=uncultured Friedmanniella sp. TaxID=335381 RepID=UPI0035C99A09
MTSRALANAVPAPYWLDRPERPVARPRLVDDVEADLVVVGAGFTGLWAALQAVEADPTRQVVLLEGDRIAEGATGRNGGFCAASLTHGLGNGLERFAAEMPTLLRMGAQTLDAIEDAIRRHGIACDFERTGELDVAVARWQVEGLAEQYRLGTELGLDLRLLDTDEVRAEVASPTYLSGVYDPDGVAMLDPARLAWGLAAALERLGVVIHEHSRVDDLALDGPGVRVTTAHGTVRAAQVLLATAASPPVLRRISAYVVPVWDYALMTEPLPADVRASLGWAGRQGIGDAGNQFHYYRLTSGSLPGDSGGSSPPEGQSAQGERLLFGGYDALYFAGGKTDPRLAQHPRTFALLAEHLVQTFPQLADVAISHAWGGTIDTCSRFSPFWGQALRGRVAYVLGFTGLGVGASHFGARTALDLLDGRDTERTRLAMVRGKPLPFPPEPVRWAGIQLTRRALAAADEHEGRRGPWLRTLDRLGMGFDS